MPDPKKPSEDPDNDDVTGGWGDFIFESWNQQPRQPPPTQPATGEADDSNCS